MEIFRMKLTIDQEVDQQWDKFYTSLFVIIDGMHFNADMKKQEITKILIRNLKIGIDETFREYQND